MKQLLQTFSNGLVEIAEIPVPQSRSGHVVIRSEASLVSIGTERMLIQFGRSGWIEKARSQPEKVKQVLDKVRTDGLGATVETVRAKLEQPTPLGYSNAGRVVAVGAGVTEFKIGDRVVSNGPHAEIVSVPKNLCAKIPDNVSFEAAAFTVVSSVALQGIRLAAPALGESFAVVGLGLIGLLGVQILKAQGVRVIGIDFDRQRCELARTFGGEAICLADVEDPLGALMALTDGRGIDGSIITAATESAAPVELSAKACRQRGRIVLVGTAGLKLNREDFYHKEISFQVSCSYGPGRYDPNYELRGIDYPFGLVRWTAQRNFLAVLDLMGAGRLVTAPLISSEIPFLRAASAYSDDSLSKSLGLLLKYAADASLTLTRVSVTPPAERLAIGVQGVGLIGAGQYAGHVLVKSLKASGARLKAIASPSGTSAALVARKGGFEEALSDSELLFDDPAIGTIVISTRHDLHVPLALRALRAGKHVFVEKPLAVNFEQLAEIREHLVSHTGLSFMVGFNRRFAPLVRRMKGLLDSLGKVPKNIVITVNAGELPVDHWLRDPTMGGGRLVGEGCHFVDLARFLAAAPIVAANAVPMTKDARSGSPDSFHITLSFENGSVASGLYLANGAKSFPKERVEVFCAGRVLQLDNFKRLRGYGFGDFSSEGSFWAQDKGHVQAMAAFIGGIAQGKLNPIPSEELLEVSQWTLELGSKLGGIPLEGELSTKLSSQSSITNIESNV